MVNCLGAPAAGLWVFKTVTAPAAAAARACLPEHRGHQFEGSNQPQKAGMGAGGV